MKIRKFRVENFGSYPVLEMDLDNAGMCLLYGPTGAGKSTIMDAVCWCLYGITAKDGNADDVRSWSSDEATTGSIVVEAKGNEYVINRVRGRPSQNDLVIHGTRGVNVTETQKIIDERLGVDAYTFIAASYFNEFSPTGSFFVARAKDRRELFEKLANLSFPNTLTEKLADRKKETKKQFALVSEAYVRDKTKADNIGHMIRSLTVSKANWDYNQALMIENTETDKARYEENRKKDVEVLRSKSLNFEFTKAEALDGLKKQIEELSKQIQSESYFNDKLGEVKQKMDQHVSTVCTACGQNAPANHLKDEIVALEKAKLQNSVLEQKRINLTTRYDAIEKEVNTYEDQATDRERLANPYDILLQEQRAQANPYSNKLATFISEEADAVKKAKDQETLLGSLKSNLSHLDQLYDMCPTLRAELLKMAINAIQEETNNYLERYFDSELRIHFTLDGDSLDVGVQKSGNSCSYKQLSKGQRQLLKLTFALSVMAASANQSGVKFENLFFDEALDGLDEKLKLKAFTLFEALEPSFTSIFLIDHAPAFQNMFTKKFAVGIEGDKSYIKEQHE